MVVPTHDTREITLRCLASLAPLAADGGEVVVVDDGSRDGTADAVHRLFPAARVLRSTEARGFTAAANEGLARGPGRAALAA